MIFSYNNYRPIKLALKVALVAKLASFILLVGIFTCAVQAQNPEAAKIKIDKSKLGIKPNSRDMNVVIRSNNLQRLDRQRNNSMIKKTPQLRQQKALKRSVNQSRRQEMMQRRKQMMEQRSRLRR